MKKIQKGEVGLIVVCAVAMVIFMLFVTSGNMLVSLIVGANSGAGGGCLGCLFKRWIDRKFASDQKEKKTEQIDGSDS